MSCAPLGAALVADQLQDPFWLGIRTLDKFFFSVFVMSFCAVPPCPSSFPVCALLVPQPDPLLQVHASLSLLLLPTPRQALCLFVDLPLEQCSKYVSAGKYTALPV